MQMQGCSADREIVSRKTNFLLIVLRAAVRHPAVRGGAPGLLIPPKRVKMQKTCCWDRDLEGGFERELCSQATSLEIVFLMLIFHQPQWLCTLQGPGANVLKASLPMIHPLLSGFNNYFIHYFVHSFPSKFVSKELEPTIQTHPLFCWPRIKTGGEWPDSAMCFPNLCPN